MRVIKKVLHEKRKTTEAHIQQLQQAGKQGVRYTAMMPDIPFLMLGLISDIGWMIHLIAGVIYFCRNGFCHVLDYYRITRCPICAYAEKLGVSELMPLFCELDEVMITLQHGVLHRKQTLANGGEFCDYYITGNRE